MDSRDMLSDLLGRSGEAKDNTSHSSGHTKRSAGWSNSYTTTFNPDIKKSKLTPPYASAFSNLVKNHSREASNNQISQQTNNNNTATLTVLQLKDYVVGNLTTVQNSMAQMNQNIIGLTKSINDLASNDAARNKQLNEMCIFFKDNIGSTFADNQEKLVSLEQKLGDLVTNAPDLIQNFITEKFDLKTTNIRVRPFEYDEEMDVIRNENKQLKDRLTNVEEILKNLSKSTTNSTSQRFVVINPTSEDTEFDSTLSPIISKPKVVFPNDDTDSTFWDITTQNDSTSISEQATIEEVSNIKNPIRVEGGWIEEIECHPSHTLLISSPVINTNHIEPTLSIQSPIDSNINNNNQHLHSNSHSETEFDTPIDDIETPDKKDNSTWTVAGVVRSLKSHYNPSTKRIEKSLLEATEESGNLWFSQREANQYIADYADFYQLPNSSGQYIQARSGQTILRDLLKSKIISKNHIREGVKHSKPGLVAGEKRRKSVVSKCFIIIPKNVWESHN